MGRQKSLHTAMSEAKQVNLVPRVAFAVPKHRQPSTENESRVAGVRPSASAPAIARGDEPPPKRIDYLHRRPQLSTLEKELTNNRIKIMNMKTDYHRMR